MQRNPRKESRSEQELHFVLILEGKEGKEEKKGKKKKRNMEMIEQGFILEYMVPCDM